jgi:hypothetical protein
METIGFDALTAAAIAHHLETRRLPQGLVAWLMLDAARQKRQAGRQGVTVKITGWTSMGDPIVPGDDGGVMTMKVDMTARDGAPRVQVVGKLARTGGRLRYVTSEIGLSDKARFSRIRNGRMKLELRQHLPDTMLDGATALIGRPLSDLVGHAALDRAEATGIVIAQVGEPEAISRNRVGAVSSVKEGLDFEVETPEVIVTAGL